MLGLGRDDVARRAAVRYGLRADAGDVRSVVPAPEPHDADRSAPNAAVRMVRAGASPLEARRAHKPFAAFGDPC